MPHWRSVDQASRAALRLFWLALGFSVLFPIGGRASPANAGFAVEWAALRVVGTHYVIDARINFAFSDENIEAMRNGVPLTVIIDIEVRRELAHWWRNTLAARELRYRIETNVLTNRYRIRTLGDGGTRNFRALEEMVETLGRLRSIPVIARSRISADAPHTARIRARLDIEALPSPLRPIAYLNPQWRLDSGWFRMAGRTMNRFGQGAGPIIMLGLVLFGSTYLMSIATQDSEWFGELYSALLALNAVALIGLGGLIAWNLYELLHQARQRRPGAKLTVRMVIVFVVLSVTPVTVVYYFSLQFLHRGIDSWFDVRIEDALDDALVLSRTALGVRMRELLAQTARIASDLEALPADQAVSALDDARLLSAASELTLIGANGHIIGSSNVDPTAVVPNRPGDAVMFQAREAGDYIGLDEIGDSGLHVRVVVAVPSHHAHGEVRLLQALFPVTERMNALAGSVESASAKYRELSYLRKPLKLSFTLTLSIVLLVSLFIAVYAAFRSARRMVAPLQDLSEGTKAVAGGNFETQLPGAAQDEIGFLVASFNEMTRKLKQAHDETRASQLQVEAQHAYLEAVLRRLSTGVLTLDSEHRLVTANHAATEILGVDLDRMLGTTLDDLAGRHPQLDPLVHTLYDRLAETTDDGWLEGREEVSVDTPRGRRVLVCSAASLAGGEGDVIVFDDATDFIQAQRNAAWSEMARRLAHEIKNPLTPIQLSAERLRHKYLHKVQSIDAAQDGSPDTYHRPAGRGDERDGECVLRLRAHAGNEPDLGRSERAGFRRRRAVSKRIAGRYASRLRWNSTLPRSTRTRTACVRFCTISSRTRSRRAAMARIHGFGLRPGSARPPMPWSSSPFATPVRDSAKTSSAEYSNRTSRPSPRVPAWAWPSCRR